MPRTIKARVVHIGSSRESRFVAEDYTVPLVLQSLNQEYVTNNIWLNFSYKEVSQRRVKKGDFVTLEFQDDESYEIVTVEPQGGDTEENSGGFDTQIEDYSPVMEYTENLAAILNHCDALVRENMGRAKEKTKYKYAINLFQAAQEKFNL